MTRSDQRTEPVYEIDLRDLAEEDRGVVVIPEAEEAPPGVAGLEHPDPAVRLAALEQLIGRPEPIPVGAVAARLRDPDPSVRRAAIHVLDDAGDERALVLLLDAMQDPLGEIRAAGGEALRRHRSPELLEAIRRKLRGPIRAEAAERALAMLDEDRPRAEAPLDPPPDDPSALLDLLADPRPEGRRIACERLGYRRVRDAVEPLIERLADPERGVRIKAADALAHIGDERAVEPLERARVADPDPGVAGAMERAIRRLTGA